MMEFHFSNTGPMMTIKHVWEMKSQNMSINELFRGDADYARLRASHKGAEDMKDRDMEVTKEKRKLPVKLTDDEYRMRAKRLGEISEEMETLEAEFKISRSDHKSAKDTLLKEAKDLSESVRTGMEDRMVEVEFRKDFKAGIARIVRLDMDVENIVSERKLTEEERQGTLPFDKEKAKADKEAKVKAAADAKANETKQCGHCVEFLNTCHQKDPLRKVGLCDKFKFKDKPESFKTPEEEQDEKKPAKKPAKKGEK